MRKLATALGAVVLLTGCLAQEQPQSAPPPAPTPAPTPSPVEPEELESLRIEAGLPECPETEPGAPAIDGGLPATELPCLGTDQTVNLAGLAGEPMVINLWAQWCAPCREESPYLREVSETSEVPFIGINYQDPQPELALQFAGLVEWHYPHIQDMDRTLRTDLQVPGLPVTLFVAADGTIAGRHAGAVHSTEELTELMERYLGTS